jgi:hypothetical protein
MYAASVADYAGLALVVAVLAMQLRNRPRTRAPPASA